VVACVALAAGVALAQTPAPKSSTPPSGDQDKDQPTLRDDKEVIAASEKWLKLLDDGHLAVAWDNAAPILKTSVTRNQWVDGIGAARKPFGKVKSRSADRFARAHQMPGAPDGDYALIAFQTRFANGKKAEEQVIWQLGDDDTWHVSGYYIR
jgi:hypothetical protein